MTMIAKEFKIKKGKIRKKPFQPLPELVIPGEWVSREGSGSVNLIKKTFTSPYSDKPGDLAIRLHEYLHLKLSPARAKGLRGGYAIRALEDMRVNHLGSKMGLMDGKFLESFEVDDYIPEDEYFLFLTTIARAGFRSMMKMANALPPDLRKLNYTIRKRLRNKPTYKMVTILAKEIEAIFSDKYKHGGKLKLLKEKAFPLIDEALADSGTMSITKRKLDTPIKMPVNIKKRRTDMGMVPTDLNRLYGDGRIFTLKKKIKNALKIGTLLIDVSGSMHINPELLKKILLHNKGVTVAIYSGGSNKGLLAIIGERNRIASDLSTGGSGNIIDIPALLWLSEQKEPRIWVCDGMVTGKRDSFYDSIAAAAPFIARIGKISQVLSLDNLAEELNI